MKDEILNFFIKEMPCRFELQELKDKYFLDLKTECMSCESNVLKDLRIKYIRLLENYDF
jgi:hypothetical protein